MEEGGSEAKRFESGYIFDLEQVREKKGETCKGLDFGRGKDFLIKRVLKTIFVQNLSKKSRHKIFS